MKDFRRWKWINSNWISMFRWEICPITIPERAKFPELWSKSIEVFAYRQQEQRFLVLWPLNRIPIFLWFDVDFLRLNEVPLNLECWTGFLEVCRFVREVDRPNVRRSKRAERKKKNFPFWKENFLSVFFFVRTSFARSRSWLIISISDERAFITSSSLLLCSNVSWCAWSSDVCNCFNRNSISAYFVMKSNCWLSICRPFSAFRIKKSKFSLEHKFIKFLHTELSLKFFFLFFDALLKENLISTISSFLR